MNIKTRLTIRFLIMVSSIWLIASATIYFSSSNYRKEEFYRRLEVRSTIAARLLIELEEVDAQLLLKIESANPIKLPGEKISIYNYLNEEIFSTDTDNSILITDDKLDQIRLNRKIEWNQGQIEVLGILFTEKQDRFVVISAAEDIYGKSKLQNLLNILIIVFIISIAIVFVVGRIYAHNALQPISEVVKEVNTIEAQNLDKRISEGNGTDEIATLGITFNKMLDRLENSFSSQRSFITNASHELRTPLTSILSQIDVITLKDRDTEEYKRILLSIRDDVKNLTQLSNKLLLLARTESLSESLTAIRVDAILWSVIYDVQKQQPEYKINIELDANIDDENYLMINGNEAMLRSAFNNFIENSCKFSEDQSSFIKISIAGENLVIEFDDNGIGIPESELKNISQPFYRASNAISIEGHGIGLSLSKRIIELHNGNIIIDSNTGSGTRISVIFQHLKF